MLRSPLKSDVDAETPPSMQLTSAQIGRSGELLVQYRLLCLGIESSPMSTDAGIDLVAYSPEQSKARTVQVKTNLKPKPGAAKAKKFWTGGYQMTRRLNLSRWSTFQNSESGYLLCRRLLHQRNNIQRVDTICSCMSTQHMHQKLSGGLPMPSSFSAFCLKTAHTLYSASNPLIQRLAFGKPLICNIGHREFGPDHEGCNV